MKTAGNFLDDVKALRNLSSDYQLAKFFGWHQQRVTNYRRGSTFDDDAAVEVAEALKVDPGYIAACMASHRAQSEKARKVWEKVAAR